MTFRILECIQCGTEFKQTNPRQLYCRNACRVAAHRDRHGYQRPIFDQDDIQRFNAFREIAAKILDDANENIERIDTNSNLKNELKKIMIELGV